MHTATLTEIKKELKGLGPDELTALCLRLAKYKKENKELLTYLIFEAEDEEQYIRGIKLALDDMVGEVNTSHIYYAKKGIRKMLRTLTKYIRYSGKKQTEAELLIHFCKMLKEMPIDLKSSTAMENLYNRQLAKIDKALSKLHEDIQFDYQEELEALVL